MRHLLLLPSPSKTPSLGDGAPQCNAPDFGGQRSTPSQLSWALLLALPIPGAHGPPVLGVGPHAGTHRLPTCSVQRPSPGARSLAAPRPALPAPAFGSPRRPPLAFPPQPELWPSSSPADQRLAASRPSLACGSLSPTQPPYEPNQTQPNREAVGPRGGRASQASWGAAGRDGWNLLQTVRKNLTFPPEDPEETRPPPGEAPNTPGQPGAAPRMSG